MVHHSVLVSLCRVQDGNLFYFLFPACFHPLPLQRHGLHLPLLLLPPVHHLLSVFLVFPVLLPLPVVPVGLFQSFHLRLCQQALLLVLVVACHFLALVQPELLALLLRQERLDPLVQLVALTQRIRLHPHSLVRLSVRLVLVFARNSSSYRLVRVRLVRA